MSYDILVVTHDAPKTEHVADALPARASLQGDFEFEGTLSVQSARWQLSIDGPSVVEHEDLPHEIAWAVLNPRWITEIHVPYGAPKIAFSVASRIGRHVARVNSGAAFDPQLESFLHPRNGIRRKPKRTREALRSELHCEFLVDHRSLSEAATEFLSLVGAHLPECLPRRFGAVEPYQHRFPEDRDAFMELWAEELTHGGALSWSCAHPGLHGSVSWSPPRGPRFPPDVINPALVSIDALGDALQDDPPWREAVRDAFTRIARGLGAFYARAVQTPPRPRKIQASEVYELGHASAWFRGWHGVPRHPAWLTWLGREFLPHLRGAKRTIDREDGALLVEERNLRDPCHLHTEIPDELYRIQVDRPADDSLERFHSGVEFLPAPTVVRPATGP